jgi:hypothetical protein
VLKPEVQKNFLNLFYHEIKDHVLSEAQNSTLNLFVLKIENNKFLYDDLVDELSDCIITFSLSRSELDRLKESKGGKKYKLAVSKLRDYKSNEGEVGEILLYCFLESHLNAPKVFTKLELKTSSNDYVKGSDGVHLLDLGSQRYQLIFGQSKLEFDLTDGVTAAIKSISDFVKRKKNNLQSEIKLLSAHLKKEAIDDSGYQFLKKIIIPTESENSITRDNAFGIFLGFDLKIMPGQRQLNNSAFREQIRKRIKTEVENRIEHIKKKISEYKLESYSFYVYVLPFTNLAATRKELIEKLV